MKRTRVVVLALFAALVALPVLPASAEDPPPAPTLTLSMNKPSYTALDDALFTSQVSAMNLDWNLALQFPGSNTWKVLCFNLNVNQDTFKCDLSTRYNVKIRVQLTDPADGDAVRAEITRNVGVRAYLQTQLGGYHGASGSYGVYPKGKSPKFTSRTYPALPGQRCLRHVVQRRYASGWRNVATSACRTEQAQGKVDWTWAGKHRSKVKFRVRATFAGDAANLANAGGWEYFRFR